MLSEFQVPEIKGGLLHVKNHLKGWRVIEKNNIITCFKEFPLGNSRFLARLSIDGLNVFKQGDSLMSSLDFPSPSDSYSVLKIGEVLMDGSHYFTDYAYSYLFMSNEETYAACKEALLFLGNFYIKRLNLSEKVSG